MKGKVSPTPPGAIGTGVSRLDATRLKQRRGGWASLRGQGRPEHGFFARGSATACRVSVAVGTTCQTPGAAGSVRIGV